MLDHAALLAFMFLGTLFPLVPLVFHSQNGNFAVCCLCAWLSVGNIIPFVNGVVWNRVTSDNKKTLGQGYCDVSIRLYLILQPCLVGCAAAILRYLSIVLSSKGAIASRKQSKLRNGLIDACIIFGPALLIIILQLTAFQYSRYDITPFFGCVISIQPTKPSIILYLWSPLVGLIALFYACMILLHLNRKRAEFKEILQNSQSGLNVARFARLFALAGLAALVVTPANLYIFAQYVKDSVIPYSDKHQKPGPIFIYYSTEVTAERNLWSLWFMALVSIALSALLGLSREASKAYRQWMMTLGITPLLARTSHALRSTCRHLTKHERTNRGEIQRVSSIESSSEEHKVKSAYPEYRGDVHRMAYLNLSPPDRSQSKMETRIWSQEHNESQLPSPNKIKIDTRSSQHFITNK